MANESARGPYAGGLARREAILDATVEMIAEVGYHGLSMRDVARRVGISHPGVIYHFPSKEALLMAVVERYEEQASFDPSAIIGLPAMDVFQAFMELTEQLQTDKTIVEMECMLAVESSAEILPAHDHFNLRITAMREVFQRAFSDLAEQGILRDGVDPEHASVELMGEWYGLLIQWLYDPERMDVSALLAESIIGKLDLSSRDTVQMILDSKFHTPPVIRAIEQVSGMSMMDLVNEGFIELAPEDLASYGMEALPVELATKVLRSGIVTSEDLDYMFKNHSMSIDLLGRLVVGQALTQDEFTQLGEVGVVSPEAVSALTAVMMARPADK